MVKSELVEYLEACKLLGKTSVTVDIDTLLKILIDVPDDTPNKQLKSSVNLGWDGGGFS